MAAATRIFTLQELAQYDGQDGRPAYIAYKGKVYDVSQASLWADGEHQMEHTAGHDLTTELASAPHGEETLDRVPVMGELAPS